MKQLVVYYVPTYMPESKLTYKRHKNQIMTDDRCFRQKQFLFVDNIRLITCFCLFPKSFA